MSVSEQRTRTLRKCPLFEGRQGNFTFKPSWVPLCTPHGKAGMDIPPPRAGPAPEAWAPTCPEWGSDSGCRRPWAPQTSSPLFLPPSPARGHQSGLHRPQVTALRGTESKSPGEGSRRIRTAGHSPEPSPGLLPASEPGQGCWEWTLHTGGLRPSLPFQF